MNGLIKKSSKIVGFIGMIVLFLAATMSLIVNLSGFPDGFIPVLGHILLVLFDIAVMVAIPLTLVLRKEQLFKYALAVVSAFWFIQLTYNTLGSTYLANGNYSGITIAVGVFNFFIGACLIGCAVLAVLHLFLHKKMFLQLALCVLIGSLLFFLIDWILVLARYAKFDADWASYIDATRELLIMPTGMALVLWHFLGKTLAPAEEQAPAADETDCCEEQNKTGVSEDEQADSASDEVTPANEEAAIEPVDDAQAISDSTKTDEVQNNSNDDTID